MRCWRSLERLVIKFFLHISKEDQSDSSERLDDPSSSDFRKGDLIDRGHWDNTLRPTKDDPQRTIQNGPLVRRAVHNTWFRTW